MSLAPSPFVVGRPLRSDEPIFGREEAFAFIHDSLVRYESVNLVGERRMGKTSLLHHLLGHPPAVNDRWLIEVDLQAHVTAAADFYGRALRGMLDHPQAQAMPNAAATLQRLQALPQADFAEFEAWLRKLRLAQGKRPVLLVDEFERLLEPQFAAGWVSQSMKSGLAA